MIFKRKLYENKVADIQVVTYYPNWWDAYWKNKPSKKLLEIDKAENHYGDIHCISINYKTCVVDFRLVKTTFDEVPVIIQLKINVSPPKQNECLDKFSNTADMEMVKDEEWYIEKYSAMSKFYYDNVNTEQELRNELESLLTFFDGVPYRALKVAAFSNNSSEIEKVRGLVEELEQHSGEIKSERTIREFKQLITQVDQEEDLLSIIKERAEEKLKQYNLLVRECSISVEVTGEPVSEVGKNAIQSFNLIYTHDQNKKAHLAYELDRTTKDMQAKNLKLEAEQVNILNQQKQNADNDAAIQNAKLANKHKQNLNNVKEEENEILDKELMLQKQEDLLRAQDELRRAEEIDPVKLQVYGKKMDDQLGRRAIEAEQKEKELPFNQQEMAVELSEYEGITRKKMEMKKKAELDRIAFQTDQELAMISSDAAVIDAMTQLPTELPDRRYTAEQVRKLMDAKQNLEREEIASKIAAFKTREAIEKELLTHLYDILMEEYRLAESANQQSLLLNYMNLNSLDRDRFIKGLGDALSKAMQGVKDMNPTITLYGDAGGSGLNPLNALKEFSQFSDAAVPFGKIIKEALEKIMMPTVKHPTSRPAGTRRQEKEQHNGAGLNGEMIVPMDDYNHSGPDLSDIS